MHTFDALRLLNLLVSLALLALLAGARPRFVGKGLGRVHTPLMVGTALLLLNSLFGLASWEKGGSGTYDQLRAIWAPLGTRISFLVALVWWLRAPSREGRSPSPSR